MGLLDKTTHKKYYQSNNLGSYQFTSLNNIIDQFHIAYVGEDKIISKIKRADIAFHAQRAMQELSFDTFKSIKSQQIDVPSSLTMPLPHDYVNYTKLTWVDGAGIEHPLYPTSRTSNPFQIKQEDDNGEYSFPEELQLVKNNDFSGSFVFGDPWYRNATPEQPSNKTDPGNVAEINITSEVLTFSHRTRESHGVDHWGQAMAVWQEIDTSDVDYLDIRATGNAVDMTNGPGILRFGLSTSPADSNTKNIDSNTYSKTDNVSTDIFDLVTKSNDNSYLEWLSTDADDLTKELLNVDVRTHSSVYVIVVSYQDFDGNEDSTLTATNNIDDLSVINSYASEYLAAKVGNERESSTWNSYKSNTPSENNNDDYEDDTYWPHDGRRYGLDPQHAQINGSFFIDLRLGRIHFSSNISGKTIILDYISDSLGTDGEMQVHKFAEEAMYKSILCAIMSAKANIGRNQLTYYKKEKFAAVRQAKLRLSNIKLEELTQILRGKSKHIKH